MNLIVIRRVSENSDNERFRSKFQYDVLEKWFFFYFRGPFYDDLINQDDSY